MSDMFGFNFTPDASNRMRQSFNSGMLPNNASEALRILSLHLPAMLAGNPIGPESLLQGGLPGRGPMSPVPLGSQPPPSATAGPVAQRPFSPTPAPTEGPSGGQGGYSGTSPSIVPGGPGGPNTGTPPAGPGWTDPITSIFRPAPPGPDQQGGGGNVLELLHSLFSGMDVRGGGGRF